MMRMRMSGALRCDERKYHADADGQSAEMQMSMSRAVRC